MDNSVIHPSGNSSLLSVNEKQEEFFDLSRNLSDLNDSVSSLPLINAAQVPVLKDADKALDKKRWKDLRDKAIDFTGKIAGKIKQLEVIKTLYSKSSGVGEKESVNLEPIWKECSELKKEAERIVKDLEEMQTTLKNVVFFWEEESQAIHHLWNGGKEIWPLTSMVSTPRHGIGYHYQKLDQHVQQQQKALQLQESDVESARCQLQFKQEFTQLLEELGIFIPLLSDLKTFQINLEKQQKQIESFNVLEAQSKELQQTMEKIPPDFPQRYQHLKNNQEEMFNSSCFFLQDPKIKVEKEVLKQFEAYFNSINHLLVQFVRLKEKLQILKSIYYYQLYPQAQEASIDWEKENADFEALKRRREDLVPLNLNVYTNYFAQVNSLKKKQVALASLITQVQTSLGALKKMSLAPSDEPQRLTVYSFIDARSEIRQKGMILMQKIVSLNEEIKTGIARKESFLPLFFRFEPLKAEISEFEKEKNSYLQALDANLKEIQDRLSAVGDFAQQLKKGLEGLTIYSSPFSEAEKEKEEEKVALEKEFVAGEHQAGQK